MILNRTISGLCGVGVVGSAYSYLGEKWAIISLALLLGICIGLLHEVLAKTEDKP